MMTMTICRFSPSCHGAHYHDGDMKEAQHGLRLGTWSSPWALPVPCVAPSTNMVTNTCRELPRARFVWLLEPVSYTHLRAHETSAHL
eukprot:61067-Alexandrium_andersonii.AAC.1